MLPKYFSIILSFLFLCANLNTRAQVINFHEHDSTKFQWIYRDNGSRIRYVRCENPDTLIEEKTIVLKDGLLQRVKLIHIVYAYEIIQHVSYYNSFPFTKETRVPIQDYYTLNGETLNKDRIIDTTDKLFNPFFQ